jgi:hypothetical protein
MYYKLRIEGWVEVSEEYIERHGFNLQQVAYEMSQGNGICTLFDELTRTNNHADLDGGAENFYVNEDDDEESN